MAEAPEQLARLRAACLDALCLGAPPPAADCAAWLTEVVPPGTARGVAEVPEPWRAALAWCGVPLARGPLRWGVDLRVAPALAAPRRRGRQLELPAAEQLSQLSAVALQPLRRFIAERLGFRLQMAPGVRLWLWPERALVLSLRPQPLLGFCYGPSPGHRVYLELPPWGWQTIAW
ncbi:MAG: hypothetical protein RMM29_01790 [Planctomycetota bacterium]|nr:hypothetical protein [Planctomycetota bacterium]MDW8372368.1 hypothetical protein [Planctomycetota bacterium]